MSIDPFTASLAPGHFSASGARKANMTSCLIAWGILHILPRQEWLSSCDLVGHDVTRTQIFLMSAQADWLLRHDPSHPPAGVEMVIPASTDRAGSLIQDLKLAAL